MKYLFGTLLIVMSLSGFMSVAKSPGARAKPAGSDKNSYQQKTNVKSDHTFDQSVVQGKYQVGADGLAVVEDEKNLDDLLGMRFEFKDRLRKQTR